MKTDIKEGNKNDLKLLPHITSTQLALGPQGWVRIFERLKKII